MIEVAAFTIKATGILRELRTEVGVLPSTFASHEGVIPQFQNKPVQAIWDTGATASVINDKTADELGFQSVGFANVSTANGICSAPVYICDIYLPTGIVVPTVEITGGNLGDNTDMLIGMDVIALGDFTITNLGGDTWFTYRMPSMQRADYKAIPKPNSEQICPCGSTKKYKNCCQPIAKKILASIFKPIH